MPTPDSAPLGSRPPGLFVSVRAFWRVLISTLHTRLDLVTTELEDTAVRVGYLIAAAATGLVCLHGAFFFFMLWILAAVWDTHYRLWVIGAIFLIYLGAAVGFLVYARSLVAGRPRFMGQTLDELKRDVEGFQTAVKSQEEKL